VHLADAARLVTDRATRLIRRPGLA
jgi:hypothetical protein